MSVVRGLFFIAVLAAAVAAFAQQTAPPKKIWDGVFTAEQARRGKGEFDQTCSRCHNLALIRSERGPAIKGPTFLPHWDKGSVADLLSRSATRCRKAVPAR